MIIRINLLSPEDIKKAEHPEIFFLAGVVVALVLLIAVFNYIVKVSSLHSALQELSLLESEKMRYQELVNQLNAIQQSRNQLQQKKDIINTLLDLRFVYPQFMEDLLGVFPAGVWVTNMTTNWTPSPGQISFNISAGGQDIYAIAELVNNLEKNNMFSGTNLGTIAQAGGGKDLYYTFQISASYTLRKSSAGASK